MAECPYTKKIFLFQDLEGDEVDQVAGSTSSYEFPAGSIILREGEEGDSMFIMCQGEVEITKRLTLELDEDPLELRGRSAPNVREGVLGQHKSATR